MRNWRLYEIFFKNGIKIILDTIAKRFDQSTCWLCEKEFKLEDVKENPFVKGHCQLTGKFRGLVHIDFNMNTGNAHTSFVPILFHNFSRSDCHLIFGELVNMASEKVIKIKEEDIIAKSSENYISDEKGCLKFLDIFWIVIAFWMPVSINYLQH